MKRSMMLFSFIIGLVLLLTACNLPLAAPTQTNVQTAVAATLAAIAQGNQPSLPTAIINTQVPVATQPALPTNTPLPTLTPYPTYTPYPTATQIPCNQAKFEGETIVDNTHFAGGAAIPKTWTLKNVGSCTWTTSYKVVFDTGNALGAPASINLPNAVAPQQTIVISIPMTAPATAGTYKGSWKLQDNNGNIFGLGPLKEPFTVLIIVDNIPFAIKSAAVSTMHTHIESTCPVTITFKADITSSAAGTAKVWWVFSDGSTLPPQDITFSSASTVTITTSWTIGMSFTGWAEIYNDYPNHQLFDMQRANFDLVCLP